MNSKLIFDRKAEHARHVHCIDIVRLQLFVLGPFRSFVVTPIDETAKACVSYCSIQIYYTI